MASLRDYGVIVIERFYKNQSCWVEYYLVKPVYSLV